MPRTIAAKRSRAQKQQLAAIHARKAADQVPDAPAEVTVASLATLLTAVQEELHTTQVDLAVAESDLQGTQELLQTSEKTAADLKHAARVERRKLQRAVAAKEKLKAQIKLLETADKSATAENAKRAVAFLQETNAENAQLKNKLSNLLDKCALESKQSEAQNAKLHVQLQKSRRKVKNLRNCVNRISEVKATAVKHTTKENQSHKLCHKGVYSPETRQLACELVIAGCTQEYVGNVIQQVCGAAGVTVDKKMSR